MLFYEYVFFGYIKTGGTSEEEMNGFISFFSRFALSLQKISLLEKKR